MADAAASVLVYGARRNRADRGDRAHLRRMAQQQGQAHHCSVGGVADRRPSDRGQLQPREQIRADAGFHACTPRLVRVRSAEHTTELTSLIRISSAVFCWKKTTNQ